MGLVPVVLAPGLLTVRLWWLATVALVGVDLLLALSPRRLTVTREPVPPVRLGVAGASSLLLTNPASRRLRAVVRDAWQPSAGARGERHTVVLRGGERTRVTTVLHPTRRGDRQADRVTIRSLGPLGLAGRQRSVEVAGTIRALPPFTSRKHLPSRLALLRQLDGRSAGRGRGQGTEFDSLRESAGVDAARGTDGRARAGGAAVGVRTGQPERDRRLILVLDPSRPPAGRVGAPPRLDAAMDAALLLAALAA